MRLRLLIIIFLTQFLLSHFSALGQLCEKGIDGFSVTPQIGCVGRKIQVKNKILSAESIQYIYDFDRKQIDIPDKKYWNPDSSYIYNKAGSFVILQFGSNVSGFVSCKDITIKETRPPRAKLMSCGNGKARLTIENDGVALGYERIEINWGDESPKQSWVLDKNLIVYHQYKAGTKIPPVTVKGTYAEASCRNSIRDTTIITTVPPPSLAEIKISVVEMQADGTAKIAYIGMEGITTELMMDSGDGKFVSANYKSLIGGIQSVAIPGLDPAKVYKFKLVSKNICDDLIDSPVVSSLVLRKGSLMLDEIISLELDPYVNSSELIEYQIVRDGQVIGSTKELSYQDKNVKCGTTYQYKIVAIVNGDVRSHSAPIDVEPQTAVPETISQASVTVKEENVIETSVNIGGQGLTGTFDLIVERTVLGSTDWSKISNPDNQNLNSEDRNANTAETSYCYRFSYTNACKLSSPSFSKPVCSILLVRNVQNISWTSATPFSSETASFDVIEMDRSGTVRNELPVGTSTSHVIDLNDQEISAFRIKANSSDGGLVSFSNTVNFVRDAIMLIPDAFTPNGDGVNERFEVKSYFADSFKMSIFNRWGEVVFQTNNSSDGWDGYSKGIACPGGYYLYKIETVDTKGQTVSKAGSLLLIR